MSLRHRLLSRGGEVGPYGDAPSGVPNAYAREADELPEIQFARRRLTAEKARRENASHPWMIADSDTEEAARRFGQWRVRDPFPEIPPALLNSADIADYACATGMIHPYDPADLKSASFRMRLEGEYYFFDENDSPKHGRLLPKSHPDWDGDACVSALKIPPNSIVFVTVATHIRLPDYIAMRFNLKIDHVYKGLLLGTGPLVDPGFDGVLHIPLHNLTQEEYVLEAGEGLIWAEFTKVSPAPLFLPMPQMNRARRGAFVPFGGKGRPDRSILDYIRDAAGQDGRPRSSIPAVVKSANAAAQEARRASKSLVRLRWWNGGILATIVLAAVVPLAIFFFQTRGDINDVASKNAEQQAVIQSLQAELKAVTEQLGASGGRPLTLPTAAGPAATAP